MGIHRASLRFTDGVTLRHDGFVGYDRIKGLVGKLMLGWTVKRDRVSESMFSGKFCYRAGACRQGGRDSE